MSHHNLSHEPHKNAENKAIADEYAGRECTLNGQPARITGRLHRFATIHTKRELGADSPASAEYPWETVRRIMENNGGRFLA